MGNYVYRDMAKSEKSGTLERIHELGYRRFVTNRHLVVNDENRDENVFSKTALLPIPFLCSVMPGAFLWVLTKKVANSSEIRATSWIFEKIISNFIQNAACESQTSMTYVLASMTYVRQWLRTRRVLAALCGSLSWNQLEYHPCFASSKVRHFFHSDSVATIDEPLRGCKPCDD